MKKRTRPFKVVFKDRTGRIRVSSFETREARELWIVRQFAEERGFVTGWVEESPPATSSERGVASGDEAVVASGSSPPRSEVSAPAISPEASASTKSGCSSDATDDLSLRAGVQGSEGKSTEQRRPGTGNPPPASSPAKRPS